MDDGELNTDFEKEYFPIWCEGCNQEGIIFVDDPEVPAFAVCSRCGWEASQVWCPKCGVGGNFINDLLDDRPTSWICPDCKTEYPLPAFYYEKPFHLYFENELPAEVIARVYPQKDKVIEFNPWAVTFVFIALSLAFYFLLEILNKPLAAFLLCVSGITCFFIFYFWVKNRSTRHN